MEFLIGLLISVVIVIPISIVFSWLLWSRWFEREKKKLEGVGNTAVKFENIKIRHKNCPLR